MNVLKVRLHQEIAVYRNPVTMEIIESFPLPPPSTVLGMIHCLLGEFKYDRSVNLSIQGSYGALLRDYQHYKKFGSNRPYPIVVNILHDVDLILHIVSEDPFLKRVETALRCPSYYPYLGRAEDLVKIESVDLVKVDEFKEDVEILQQPALIPAEWSRALNLNGVPYRLPTFCSFKTVQIGKEQRDVRDFEWQDYYFVEASADFSRESSDVKIFIDDQGDFVWWCMPNLPHETILKH